MRFTVVVPTYRRQSLLELALRSVERQTFTDFECLVIDDFSPEPVELPFGDKRFRVVRRMTNGGPAAARNTGLEHATGEYVAFLDDDDEFTPVRLAVAADMLSRSDVSFCGAGAIGARPQPNSPNLVGDVYDVILDRTSPPLGTVAIRRDRCPWFDESYGAAEDLDWLLRATKNARASSSPTVGWLWRQHDEVRGRHGLEARISGSRRLFQQHQDYFAIHRKARAFREHRIAVMSLQLGRRRLAVNAAVRALLAGRLAAVKPLARAILRL